MEPDLAAVSPKECQRAAAGKGSSGVARNETPVVSIRPAEDQVIPFDRVRSAIAEHMVRSKATSPHVLQFNEVDFESIAQVRAQHGDAFKTAEGFSLTYLPFIARAVCDALSEFPRLNASIQDEALIVRFHGESWDRGRHPFRRTDRSCHPRRRNEDPPTTRSRTPSAGGTRANETTQSR